MRAHVLVDDSRPQPGGPVQRLGGRVILSLPDSRSDVGQDYSVDVVTSDSARALVTLAPLQTQVAAVTHGSRTVLYHGDELG